MTDCNDRAGALPRLRFLTRALIALALGGVPITAQAQSCLGFPLAPGQKTLAARTDDRIDAGGMGLHYGSVSKGGRISTSLDFTHYAPPGPLGTIMIEHVDLRFAGPVFRNGGAQGENGVCGIAEVGGTFQNLGNVTNFGGGLGYAFNAGRVSLFGAGILGFASAESASDSYMNVLGGIAGLAGPVMLSADITLPLDQQGAEPVLGIRAGFRWGKAVPRTHSTQPQNGGSAAPVQGAMQQGAAQPGPTAGLKPYALEDVEAMIKNGVATTRILENTYRACLSFRVTDAFETQLRRVGATPELIDGLRKQCFSAR